jgi:hypothetical protein
MKKADYSTMFYLKKGLGYTTTLNQIFNELTIKITKENRKQKLKKIMKSN